MDVEVGRGPAPELQQLRHDLRTPLAVIMGYADLLAADSLDDATRREYAARIAAAAREMRDGIDAAR